jgi:hypothetical protein
MKRLTVRTPDEILAMKFDDSKFAIKTDDSLILLIPGSKAEYEIEYDRMNTPRKVLGWVRQLSDKKWVTRDHIRVLIEMAQYNGVEIP